MMEYTPEQKEIHDAIEKRIWAAIDELQTYASQRCELDPEGNDLYSRADIVARVMYQLFDGGEELFALGAVADCLVDIIKICNEDEPTEKTVQTDNQKLFLAPPSASGH